MASQNTTPITLDLPVQIQSINTDIESIAPILGFGPDSFDVANSTITATVTNNAGSPLNYRLVIHADVESGTSAYVRVVSADKQTFKTIVEFNRITAAHADLLEPVLAKVGVSIDATKPKEQQLQDLAKHFKVADITIPPGTQVLRIHFSQVLKPVDTTGKKFLLNMYLPLLCFAPTANVRLAATLVFPLDFQTRAVVGSVEYKPLPNQPTPNLVAGGNNAVQVGSQLTYGWLFQTTDPLIVVEYTYN